MTGDGATRCDRCGADHGPLVFRGFSLYCPGCLPTETETDPEADGGQA